MEKHLKDYVHVFVCCLDSTYILKDFFANILQLFKHHSLNCEISTSVILCQVWLELVEYRHPSYQCMVVSPGPPDDCGAHTGAGAHTQKQFSDGLHHDRRAGGPEHSHALQGAEKVTY